MTSTGRIFLYVGTYTRLEGHLVTANGKGIYVYSLDIASGKLSYQSEIHGITNPSFLTLAPNGKWLYATSEIDASEPNGLSLIHI